MVMKNMAQKNQNILKYVHVAWQRRGESFSHPDSRKTKLLQFTCLVFTIVVSLINLIFVIGISMVAHNAESGKQLTNLHNGTVTVAIFTVLLILCYFLFKTKKYIPTICATILNLVCCVVLLVFFYKELTDGQDLLGLTATYVFRHAISLIILLISGTWLGAILIRYNFIENRDYNKMIDNLYRIYSSQYQELSSVQWEEYLDTYEPIRPEKLKRSRKATQKNS